MADDGNKRQMAGKERKRGRPTIALEHRRRNIVSIGMTDSLKSALEMLAIQEGCSLSRVVELSLERYFHAAYTYGETHEIQMYGRLMATAFAVGGRLAAVHKSIVEETGDNPKEWIDDPYAYDMACKEVIRALARYRPEGDAEELTLDFLDDQDRMRWFGSLLSFWESQKEASELKRSNPRNGVTDGVRKRNDAANVIRIIQLQDRMRRLRQEAEKTAAELYEITEHTRRAETPASDKQMKPRANATKNETTGRAKKRRTKN